MYKATWATSQLLLLNCEKLSNPTQLTVSLSHLASSYMHRRYGKALTASTLTGITLIRKKIKLSSYIRKFRGIGCKVIYDLRPPHIWWKYLCISSYIRKPFLIYEFAPDPIWISLYMRKIFFSFFQCTISHQPGRAKIALRWISNYLSLCVSFLLCKYSIIKIIT